MQTPRRSRSQGRRLRQRSGAAPSGGLAPRLGLAALACQSAAMPYKNRENGTPWPMKMGTSVSPWRCDERAGAADNEDFGGGAGSHDDLRTLDEKGSPGGRDLWSAQLPWKTGSRPSAWAVRPSTKSLVR